MDITTTLGKETLFKGIMKFRDSLKIDGNFEGHIESTGFLYVEQGAVVKADVKVRSAVIGGTLYGNIEAAEKVEMLSSGQVYGNVSTSKLKIADGVVFEGKCEMLKNADSVDIFQAPVDQLKKAIQGT